jgi:hypothetical protein
MLLVVAVARDVVRVRVDGSGQMMDRVDRAFETIDPDDERRGQKRRCGSPAHASQA